MAERANAIYVDTHLSLFRVKTHKLTLILCYLFANSETNKQPQVTPKLHCVHALSLNKYLQPNSN